MVLVWADLEGPVAQEGTGVVAVEGDTEEDGSLRLIFAYWVRIVSRRWGAA